jgi:polysaccharide biosynthesis protein PslG
VGARSRHLLVALCVLAFALLAPAPALAAPLAGVQAHLLWSDVDDAEVARQLDLARDAGARLVRVDVGWASVEPEGKGRWSDWYLGRLDRVVAAARARGLWPLLTFWETPCWASSAPAAARQGCEGSWWERGVQRYTPANPADYADALAFLAGRYGGRVAWEIWNEPNSDDYYRAADPARDYAALVKAAYRAAMAAAPRVTVLAGSLMWADAEFTEALYDAGIRGNFDAFSIHPYSDDRSPLDRGLDPWVRGSFIRGVPRVHDVMVEHRDAKPLWLTEFGWSTTTTRGAANWLDGVDERTQARYVGDALAQMAAWSYVQAGVYFNVVDTSPERASTIGNFGLVRHDGRPKPAYRAFRSGVKAIAGRARAGRRARAAARRAKRAHG